MTSPNAAANTNAGEKSLVYLDYAASAPMSEAALEAERAYEAAPFAGANPNSLHTLGRQAARALDGARRDLARCLGAGFRPSDVVFTSGGTESNNLALWGLAEGARQRDRKRTRVLVSAIEHDSALDALPTLRDRGFDVELLRPGRDGVVSPETVEAALDDTVALVSVMSANNETGVLQPVGAIARLAHAAGALMHTDAAQAVRRSKVPILILHGEDDRFVPAFMSEAIARENPEKIRRVTFPKAGHGLSYLVDPPRYEKAYAEFLVSTGFSPQR